MRKVFWSRSIYLGASPSGLGCQRRIIKSVFGANPIIQYHFYKEMKVFFLFYHFPYPPVFLTCPVSHTNNSSKPLAKLTKLATGQHTYRSWLSNIKEKVIKDSFTEKGFLTSWERSESHRNKKPFREVFRTKSKIYDGAFDHRKEYLKATNSTSKGSISNPLQMAVLTRYGGKAGITPK